MVCVCVCMNLCSYTYIKVSLAFIWICWIRIQIFMLAQEAISPAPFLPIYKHMIFILHSSRYITLIKHIKFFKIFKRIKIKLQKARERSQHLKAFTTLAEDPNSGTIIYVMQITITCYFSSSRFNIIFWPQRATAATYT